MESTNTQLETRGSLSRRGLLKTAAALTLAPSLSVQAQQQSTSSVSGGRVYAYVGTYTGAIGNGGNGQGIHLYTMNPANGRLAFVKVVSQITSPSWISFDPSSSHLYAVNEVSNFNGTNGSVSAFTISRSNGDLVFLNVMSSGGGGPAHLSVDPSGKFVLVANYGGGSIAVLPILSGGSLGAATDFHQDVDSLGPTRATNAPSGSFAISGHDAPHAHFIHSDPSNRYVLQTDLAQDRIYIYSFDTQAGTLSPASYASFVSLPPGDGPRHLAFHSNGKWIYSIQEEASTLIFFEFDATNGSLIPQQTISTLPRNFTGTNFTSEVLISPDGLFLYAANRLHNSIGVFSIDTTGGLTHIGQTSTLGDYPRNINIDPSGNFLYSCNQRSDTVTSFRIDRDSGLLSFTGQYLPVGSPASIIFLA